MKRSETIFYPGDPRAKAAGRKGRWKSPWQVPYNKNAIRTIRLELIRMAAEGKKS